MASIDFHAAGGIGKRRRSERRQYRALFCVAYPLFLAAAVGARVIPRSVKPASGHFERRRNVFAEARAATASCIPFAFR